MKVALACALLLLAPASAFAQTVARSPANSGNFSTPDDCVWRGEVYSVGATFCWQPSRKLTCTAPTKDHKQAWWKDDDETVCGAAAVP